MVNAPTLNQTVQTDTLCSQPLSTEIQFEKMTSHSDPNHTNCSKGILRQCINKSETCIRLNILNRPQYLDYRTKKMTCLFCSPLISAVSQKQSQRVAKMQMVNLME